MHYRELSLTTNTARLAKLALTNCEIRVRGLRGEPVDGKDIVSDTHCLPLLLYPSEDSEVLSTKHRDAARAAGKKIVLIVPDGNWRQGSKGAKRTPGLEHVQCVRLPPGENSEYRLRTAPRADYLSTFEAIARAVGILEGKDVEDRLMVYFRIKIDRMLWARGLMPTDEVRGGVPPAAIESFFIAGAKGSQKKTNGESI